MRNPPKPNVLPNCLLAHEILNKLTAILGECEFLESEIGGGAVSERLRVIRELAEQIAGRVASHSCRLEEILRRKVM